MTGGEAGDAPSALDRALADWRAESTSERTVRVFEALLRSRLLVPVVPLPVEAPDPGGWGSDGLRATELALPTLVGREGGTALPAFSSPATLARWRPEARPVTVVATEVFANARAEGHTAVVVDVAGPVPFTVEGESLERLGTGRLPLSLLDPLTDRPIEGGLTEVRPAPAPDPGLVRLLREALAREPAVGAAYLLAPEVDRQVSDVAVGLVLSVALPPAELVALVRRLAGELGPSPLIRTGLDIAVLSPAQQVLAAALGPPVYRSGPPTSRVDPVPSEG